MPYPCAVAKRISDWAQAAERRLSSRSDLAEALRYELTEQGNQSGAMHQPLVGWSEASLVLDDVELGDPIERRVGDWE